MAKKIWMIAIAAVILSACGSQTQKTENQAQEETVVEATPVQITVEEFSDSRRTWLYFSFGRIAKFTKNQYICCGFLSRSIKNYWDKILCQARFLQIH